MKNIAIKFKIIIINCHKFLTFIIAFFMNLILLNMLIYQLNIKFYGQLSEFTKLSVEIDLICAIINII